MISFGNGIHILSLLTSAKALLFGSYVKEANEYSDRNEILHFLFYCLYGHVLHVNLLPSKKNHTLCMG